MYLNSSGTTCHAHATETKATKMAFEKKKNAILDYQENLPRNASIFDVSTLRLKKSKDHTFSAGMSSKIGLILISADRLVAFF